MAIARCLVGVIVDDGVTRSLNVSAFSPLSLHSFGIVSHIGELEVNINNGKCFGS